MNPLLLALGLLLGGGLLGQPAAAPATPAPAPPLAQDADCVRGAAEPIVKKAVFPRSTFRLLPDKINGIETIACPNGDQVVIYNEGCEYYMLRFLITTARFGPPTTNPAPWFRHAATLMSGLLPGLQAPIDLPQGIRLLTARLNQDQKKPGRPLALGEDIFYGSKTMRSSVSIDSLARGAGNQTVVAVTFAIGPL
ncbi:hypothetical protein [Hymenobacter chitinivorans]|uniref:Uncharacterized protein n=1 Tax=Hymenobacter chitinivorans DSM 11115 TaxID=1121954 RepID=A0A2M9BSH6_9BACT|nr:hypothetical protein [Hymenobacter chitinivorans]PJJ60893.1 hypothetical protein CLV45_2328 [Hymenobacter chitinivorans DSM 11115]